MKTDLYRLGRAYRRQSEEVASPTARTVYRLAAIMCFAAAMTELTEAPDEWEWPDNLEGFIGE